MSDDILARFSELQDAVGGCTDGYCVVRRNRGQHTNGGCRCLDYLDHFGRQRVGHMLRAAQDMTAEITRLREQLAEARESAEAAWEQWDELQDLLGASKEVGFAFDEVVQLRKQLAEAERQRDAARAVIRRVHDTLWEINPDNYTHDEIVVANNASVEAIFLLADVLGETHGYTPEWWENRRAMIKKGRT